MRTRSLLALALVALAAVPAAGGAVAPLGEQAEAEYAPGQVIVQFAPRARGDVRADALAAVDGEQVDTLGRASTVLVEVGPGETVEQAVARLEAQPGVLSASPNWVIHGDAVPNDARFGELWGLANGGQAVNGVAGVADADIDAPEAWDLTTGSSGVVVAVIDTGIAYDHPDLAGRIFTNPAEASGAPGVDDDANGFIDDLHGWDFVGNDNDPRDLNGHGTHTAGTIGAAGNDGAGVTGVAQDVRILPLRILGANNGGLVSDSVKAINYARSIGARIVSGSYGGGPFTQAERDAIAAATNTLFVFSAGNNGRDNDKPEVSASDRPNYPCAYDPATIVCVAATDQSDGLASFSNFGATTVDVGAPGVNVLSAMPAFGAPIFADDFESGLAKWTTGGTNNTWGTQTVPDATSPSNVLADSPAGNYVASTNSFVRTAAPFSLTGQVGCRLTMQLRIRSQTSIDGVFVETSTNGTTFSTRTSFSGFTTGGILRARSIDVSLHDGAPSVWLQFRYSSNADTSVEDGVQIDDVAIRCLTSTYAGTEFQLLDGTSMAAPHVSGIAALALAFEPTLTPAQLKANLLAAVDPVPALAGKTVTGGRVNAYRTLLRSDTAAPTGLQATGAVSGQALAASWSGATDRTGIDGYSVVIDASPTTAPDAVKDLEETATGTTSGALAPGAYYVHVLAIDNAGNVGAPVHAGPFSIAAPAPPPPPAPLLPPNATLASITGGVALAKDGTVGIKLRCNALATGACRATVTLTALVKTTKPGKKPKTTRVAIGSGTSSVLPGATRTLKVKVNRKGVSLFAVGPQSVEVRIVSTDGSGAKRTFTKTFRLKRPK